MGNSDITPGQTQVFMGLTHLINEGILPETDPNLATLMAKVALQTSEHRLPVNVSVPRSISAGSLVFTKSTNSDFDKGIYELSFPIQPGASVLGYFRFRTKTAWTQFNPDWLNLTNVVGMYFGLEHQTYNTAAYAFLRQRFGSGSLVVGGPLQVFNTARPAQAEFPGAIDWLGLPNNTSVEIWIYFNSTGYSPSFTPVVEIWIRTDPTTFPVVQTTIPVGSLGTFQSLASGFPNFRLGPSGNAVLYFGNVGRTGDVLQLDDWQLFPDFRPAVLNGEAIANARRVFVPDSPGQFFAENGVLPQNVVPGRWFPVPDAGFSNPSAAFTYQPGRKQVPQALRIHKTATPGAAFQKQEPRLEELISGGMVEAFLSGSQPTPVAAAFGAGLTVEDGAFIYSAVLLQTPSLTTIGIAKTGGSGLSDFYVPSSPIDWTSLKLVRLIVDRLRLKVALMVDEVRVLEVSISGAFPASVSGIGRVIFGHLMNLGSSGTMDVARLSYLTKYKAWEIIDQKTPQDVTAAPGYSLAVSGAGTVTLDVAPPNATAAIVNKPDFSLVGSQCYLHLADKLGEVKGIQCDFLAKVLSYTDASGALFKSLTWTGAGVNLWLGTKRLHVGFFDAGTNGRVLGVTPGSGSNSDIINQTPLGMKFSTPVDWTQDTLVRVVCMGYKSINIWVGTFVGDPVITIPWRNDTDGFDLPLDSTTAAVAFGHFDALASSKTAWKAIRHGVSSGYDLSVGLNYPNGVPPVLYGGDVQVRTVYAG